MKRSNHGKENKYLSIVVVPHNTDEIKVLKISAAKYKLMTLGAVVITMIICSGLLITYLIHENRILNDDRKKVIAANSQQMDLITEREEIIQSYIKKVDDQDKLINNFSSLYRDMTSKYIDGNMEGVTATRSNLRDDRSFINDVNKLKGILDSLEEINGDETVILDDLTKTQSKLKEYVDSIPTLWPASGRISSNFGSRSDPFNFSEKQHEGLDIAADSGTVIKASASGTVTLSDWNGNYGKCIIIEHGYGLSTLYSHCLTLLVEEGQIVKKGDIIAKMGSTGRSTGPHLHFEVRLNGVPTDPLEYLDSK